MFYVINSFMCSKFQTIAHELKSKVMNLDEQFLVANFYREAITIVEGNDGTSLKHKH